MTETHYAEIDPLVVRSVYPSTWSAVLRTVAYAAKRLGEASPPQVRFFVRPDPARMAALPPQVRARLSFEVVQAPDRILGWHKGFEDAIWVRLDGPQATDVRTRAIAAHELYHWHRNRYGATRAQADDEAAADEFAREVLTDLGLPIPLLFKKGSTS